jgi:hypothetical protein
VDQRIAHFSNRAFSHIFPPMPTNGLLCVQSAMNRSTRGQWQMYGSHRQQIERLIVPASRGLRACVLGAGNCNDLDLQWMLQVYREVHLVDLDADALTQGVKRQQCEQNSKLHRHAPVDLSGVADIILTWKQSPPDDAQINECQRRLNASDGPVADKAASFDLVLSPCVLSQLLIGVRDAIGSSHPRYPQLRDALRQCHLRMISNMLAPGGQAVLAIDLVSSEDFPSLASVPNEQAPDLMRALIEKGKCFAALAPRDMRRALAHGQQATTDMRFTAPWIWHLGLHKSFLVYGMLFKKCQTAAS